MIDIPRNELLDKLAAGWKVQRKTYSMPSPALEIGLVRLSDLLANDWEGEPPEPPEPQQIHKNVSIIVAFRHMMDGAAFIKRAAWTKASIFQDVGRLTCSVDDILANDWEVWG